MTRPEDLSKPAVLHSVTLYLNSYGFIDKLVNHTVNSFGHVIYFLTTLN